MARGVEEDEDGKPDGNEKVLLTRSAHEVCSRNLLMLISLAIPADYSGDLWWVQCSIVPQVSQEPLQSLRCKVYLSNESSTVFLLVNECVSTFSSGRFSDGKPGTSGSAVSRSSTDVRNIERIRNWNEANQE
jgi:hypothetical protein